MGLRVSLGVSIDVGGGVRVDICGSGGVLGVLVSLRGV